MEVVTTAVTTTTDHGKQNDDYNITKHQIHSGKIILITEFSVNRYKVSRF
jgi:hypothetical protein